MSKSLVDNEEVRAAVAHMHAAGYSRRQIAEELCAQLHLESPPNESTISRWLKRDDIKKEVAKIMGERAQRIRRHVDTRVEALLTEETTLKKLTVKDLVAIRKEYAPSISTPQDEEDKEFEKLKMAFNAASENPEAVKQIKEELFGSAEEDSD